MAKKTKTTTRATTTSKTDLATPGDLAAANELVASQRKTPMRSVSTALVSIYSNAKLQQSLVALQPALAPFKGCGDMKTALALATEGEALKGSFARLQAAADRVGQRIVQINKQLMPVHTALSGAEETATPGSAVQKGLANVASLRQTALVVSKTKRTKNKNKKKTAASKS